MYYLLIFLVILLIVALKGPVCEECGERDASANHDGLCDRCWFLFGGDEFNKKER